jgi:hypothetical protein
MARRDDEDDWTGEPPEGRHSRDRSRPSFWRDQWQAAVALSMLGVVIVIGVILVLLFS